MKDRATGTWWVENLLRPALIAAMLVCLAAPFVVGLQEIMRAEDGTLLWQGTYFLVFCFFAGLEGILSERLLIKHRITGWAYLGSRLAEAVLLLLVLKVVNYLPFGLDQLWTDALAWPSDPGSFLTLLDSLTAALFLVLWGGALWIARMARDLDVGDEIQEPPPDKTSTEYYIWLTQPPLARDRQETLGQLTEMVLLGGVVILIASTGLHVLAPDTGLPAVAILLYFALAMALLTQARFSVTYAGWRAQKIAIQPGIGRRWLAWAALFLVAVVGLALLLPTYYTFGPLQTLLGILGMIYSVLAFVMTLLWTLLVLPLMWLLGNETPTPPPESVLPSASLPPTTARADWPWLELVASAIFWLVVLVIILYAARRFWRDRFAGTPAGEAMGAWWAQFRAWLRALWRHWRAWRRGVQVRIARRRSVAGGEGTLAARMSRFFFPGRLPPREQIRYFYLSAERRAAQAGQPRRPGQTPYEYRSSLDRQFPELEPDLEGLTEAFVGARYNPHPVHKEEAEAVKPLWQRVRAALRRRRASFKEE